jgi:hypothetical protein
MSKIFVRILSELDCEWEGLAPVYRLYINDELFSERTFAWCNEYLEENLQIEAEPGEYKLRYELVKPTLAKLKIGNLTVAHGPVDIIDNLNFRIRDEIA